MNLDAYYKIDSVSVNKTDKKDHYFDKYVKLTNWQPPAKYDLI